MTGMTLLQRIAEMLNAFFVPATPPGLEEGELDVRIYLYAPVGIPQLF